MTDLQIYDMLCSIIEQQAELIRELVTELKQINAVSGDVADRLDRLKANYDTAAGDSAP